MSIKEVEIKTFEIKYMCDKEFCSGEMKPTGTMLVSNPPQFPHKCTACGNVQNFTVKYPALAYRAVD